MYVRRRLPTVLTVALLVVLLVMPVSAHGHHRRSTVDTISRGDRFLSGFRAGDGFCVEKDTRRVLAVLKEKNGFMNNVKKILKIF